MRKEEFLAALRTALGKLPEQEILASLDFYAEMIDDRMEDGATEEEAVAAASYVKDKAASATESARAAIHEATAPKSNPTNAAPVPPPGYVMTQNSNPSSPSQDSTESAPCEQPELAAPSARPEGGSHDDRA